MQPNTREGMLASSKPRNKLPTVGTIPTPVPVMYMYSNSYLRRLMPSRHAHTRETHATHTYTPYLQQGIFNIAGLQTATSSPLLETPSH